MRFLITSDYLNLENIGGAGRVLVETAGRLARRGHTVELLTGAARGGRRIVELGGGQVRWTQFPYLTTGDRGIAYYFWLRRRIRAEYRALETRPEVILHNQPLTAASIGATAVPSIYLFHSPWPSEYLADRFGDERCASARTYGTRAQVGVALRRHIEARAVQRSDHVITLSHSMRAQAIELHRLREERVSVLAGGVDGVRFHPANAGVRAGERAHWGIGPEEFLIATVRRLVPRTGVDLLLDALALRARELGRVVLLVAGAGPEREALADRARRLGLAERVRFLGYLDDAELPALYRAADLVVMPTRALEGFGLSSLEALACSTPVVATPVGGLVEILSGLSHELVAPAVSGAALSALIQRWVEDPRALERVRERCRPYALATYSWDSFAEGVERIAVDVLQSRDQRTTSARSSSRSAKPSRVSRAAMKARTSSMDL